MHRVTMLMLIVLLSLEGCISKPFQPAPAEFTLWKRPGASAEEIKNSMMQCGFINPYVSAGMSENAYANAELCMIKRGFVNISQDGIMCSQLEYQRRLEACLKYKK